MKRTLIILLCFAALLCLAGCGEEPTAVESTTLPSIPVSSAETTQPEPSEAVTVPEQTEIPPTDPVLPVYEIPLTAISLPRVQEKLFSYPNITFLHSDAEVARTVLLALRNRVDAYRSNECITVSCDPMRIDQCVLSVVLTREAQTDGSIQAVTYDLVNGTSVSLSQLLAPDAAADVLQSMLSELLSGQEQIYSWYREILDELFSGNSLPENWYLSGEGLCFYFMPYEVAPYSVAVTIPYTALGGVIRDRYYPPELPDALGTMQAVEFENAELSRFSSFAELILDDAATSWLLYPTDVIRDVRISTVAGLEDSELPVTGDTVFATDVLTPSQAIRIQYQFTGLLSTLEIRYCSRGETHVCYLRISGEDGHVFLSE